MAPKKPKKGAPPEPDPKAVSVTEVEKTLWQLEAADLNRKIARLRAAVNEYEVRNEELQKAYDKLDEDRADIIAYLKKTLTLKNEENIELKDKVKGLEELRDIETAQFKETVNELEKNFITMKDQLSSENKLLAGKVNTLEEFRAVKKDLMCKFEAQELAFQDQEMKYKRIIYNTEKKFIIGKDKLKREMESKLLDLAQDFQDASELRIAASTHRVLRENIALNNQLDSLLMTQAKVADQNEKYKESERNARVAMEAAEEERDKAINKSIVQLKVIDQLTTAFQDIKKQKAIYDKKTFDFETLEVKVKKLTKENTNLLLQVRILEQNLHANICEQNKSTVEFAKVTKERDKYKKVLKDAAFAIQGALKMDQWSILDPEKEIRDRKSVLNDILRVILQYRIIDRSESMDTIASFSQVYEKGDMGFVPKPKPKPKPKYRQSMTLSVESVKGTESGPSATSIPTSIGSIKTVPSMQLVPAPSEPIIGHIESLPSFTVTSIHSSETESEKDSEDEEDMTDMEKKLAASKLEIQRSIMKDLAYSQMALASQAKFAEEHDKRSKSMLEIVEDESIQSGENIEEEAAGEHKHEETVEQVEGEQNIEDVETQGEEKAAVEEITD